MRHRKVLLAASVASMIAQFNMSNIRLLQEMGYEVHVTCNFYAGNTCSAQCVEQLKAQLEKMRVAYHQWDCPRGIRSAAECCKAYKQLKHLLKLYRYDWVHCHSPVGGALARLAAHRQGIRSMYTAHGFHFYQGAQIKNWLLYYPAEKLLSYWTDVIITVNQEDYALAKKTFHARQVYRIPGVGVDTHVQTNAAVREEMRQQLRRQYRIPEDACLLLSVGELSRRKNHRIVLKALAQLGQKDVYYLICGQGEQQEALRQYAQKLGVLSYLRLPGYQEELRLFYAAADIFVFPSLQEGMPVALMEAMAAGLPCVVSDIRGNQELVGSMRFHPRHAAQLKNILQQFIRNKRQRDKLGQLNSRKIQSYSLTVVEKKMRFIYKKMQ